MIMRFHFGTPGTTVFFPRLTCATSQYHHLKYLENEMLNTLTGML